MRNLKALGLAVLSVFAFSAVAASAAQAEEGHFGWEAGTARTTTSAIGTQTYTTTAGKIECNEVSGEAIPIQENGENKNKTMTGENIAYANNGTPNKCPASIGTATIQMNGCHYTFHAGETIGEDETKGTTDIAGCATNGSITVEAFGCTIHMPEQTGIGPVYYQGNTAAGDIVIHPTVTNIEYTHTGICGNGTASNGTYTGDVTVQGEDEFGGHTNISVT